MACAGLGVNRSPADHLHESSVLVDIDGGYRLVREERVSRPLDPHLDDRGSADRSRRRLGRQWLVVLAALERRFRPRDRRRRGSRTLPPFVATRDALRPLTTGPLGVAPRQDLPTDPRRVNAPVVSE